MTTIALVDDDENIRASLEILFQSEGYDTRSYPDGATALAALSASPPDLAIFDRARRAVPGDPPIVPGSEEGDRKVVTRGNLTLDPNRHLCAWHGKPVRLTVTEFLLLQALAQRPGYVKTRNQLMDAAYDDSVYVDDRTIDSHVKRIRKKFREVSDDFDMIETLYGAGYRYKEV
ncbi:MAG: response regulator transcription factor [Hyphomonadaceae bacterium]|nr:response regulator transcription factor [Hyphomonadaceae bacterium]